LRKFKGISEDLLANGYNVRIKTSGFSMFPLIWTGDKVTISPQKDVNIGDVIVFSRDGRMVGHKVVRIFEKSGNQYYQTRGDSFFRLDEPITAGRILGKVINIERGNVPLARRILLLVYPALQFGCLNAIVISALIRIRSHLLSTTRQLS
jgi:signal peptidase I